MEEQMAPVLASRLRAAIWCRRLCWLVFWLAVMALLGPTFYVPIAMLHSFD